VRDRSNVNIARAVRDGVSRATSAPAIFGGTFLVLRLLEVPAANLSLFDRGARAVIVWLLFWSFAYGGVIDRFARDRPTRAHGFFAACGGHMMAPARLALIALVLEAALMPIAEWSTSTDPGRIGAGIALALAAAILAFARIRLVVEDRRSAMGAIAAALRFVRRNPSSIVLMLAFTAVSYVVTALADATLRSGAVASAWTARASTEAFLAIQLWLKLAAYASGIALFQSRLAHAGYTAAPPAVWPESASAEAITNAEPGIAR
jgi:hypothetical protein